jgi:hypothetical protein
LKRIIPHPVEFGHVVLKDGCRMTGVGEKAMDSDIDLQQLSLTVS